MKRGNTTLNNKESENCKGLERLHEEANGNKWRDESPYIMWRESLKSKIAMEFFPLHLKESRQGGSSRTLGVKVVRRYQESNSLVHQLSKAYKA